MSMPAYYSSEGEEKVRFITEDHLDSEDFDFLQNIANDVDELRTDSTGHSEMCLNVINASMGNA